MVPTIKLLADICSNNLSPNVLVRLFTSADYRNHWFGPLFSWKPAKWDVNQWHEDYNDHAALHLLALLFTIANVVRVKTSSSGPIR